MAFADFALFAIAHEHLQDCFAVTISFSSDFVATQRAGRTVEATGRVVHAGKSLLFVSGVVLCETVTLLRFSGVMKKVRKPASIPSNL